MSASTIIVSRASPRALDGLEPAFDPHPPAEVITNVGDSLVIGDGDERPHAAAAGVELEQMDSSVNST